MPGYSKEQQLARGERRYRRKVASPKQWQAIQAAKGRTCRVCLLDTNAIQLHHLVPRDFGGDDVPENLVPLCPRCHSDVTRCDRETCLVLFVRLEDAEYAYAVEKAGEDVWARVYGLGTAETDPLASRRCNGV